MSSKQEIAEKCTREHVAGLPCYCAKCVSERKQKCLDHYSRKEPKLFCQFDGFLNCDPLDSVMVPDEHGDCIIHGSRQWELMSGSSARLLVPEDTTPDRLIRLLNKFITVIEQHGVGPFGSEYCDIEDLVPLKVQEPEEPAFTF